jgi:sterol desaturase/sphingolipid hydroxylase (fatty acid hydroxylase superfamily)
VDWPFVVGLIEGFGETLWRVLPVTLGMAAAFSLLSWLSPCNEGRPWWRKRGLLTDIGYWLFVPLFTRYLRIGIAIAVAVYLLGIRGSDAVVAFYAHGHGVLAQLPLWAQGMIYLVGSDFLLYWVHRTFHATPLWKFHAVHHASEDLEWISAWRFHPFNLLLGTIAVDVLFLALGVSPDIFLVIGPFTTLTSAWVHANLDWTLGPFKYVIAGPVFHRWHHTNPEGGRERNFAGTFSLWDWLFGTFYMPQGRLPRDYGIGQSIGAEAGSLAWMKAAS